MSSVCDLIIITMLWLENIIKADNKILSGSDSQILI